MTASSPLGGRVGSTGSGRSTRRARPARRAAAVATAALMLLSVLVPFVPPADALDDLETFHGAEVLLRDVSHTLYLHCNDGCEPQHRTLMALDVGGPGDLRTLGGEEGDAFTFAWRDHLASEDDPNEPPFPSERVANPGVLEEATATLYLSALESDANFQVRLLVDGEEVAQSATQDLKADVGEIDRYDFELDFPGPVELEGGERLEMEVSADASTWTLYLHARLFGSNRDSRIEVGGQLLAMQAWLEPPGGGDESIFNLNAPEDERRFTPNVALRPTLGLSVLYNFNVHNDDGGTIADTDITIEEPDLIIDGPPDADVTQIRQVDGGESCADLELDHDEERSTDKAAVFRSLVEPIETFGNPDPCAFPADESLQGAYDFDLLWDGPEIGGRLATACGTTDTCVRSLDVDFITQFDVRLEADEDDLDKEVLAGGSVVYNLRLVNRLSSAVSVDLSLSDPAAGWSAAVEPTEVTVPSGESRSIGVTVEAPADADPDDQQAVTVSASVAQTPEAEPDPLQLVAVVAASPQHAVTATTGPGTVAASLGDSVSYFVDVTNTGNAEETYRFSVDLPDEATGFTTDVRPTATLAAGERLGVRVTVHVPSDADPAVVGTDLPVTFTATSTTDPDVSATVERLLRPLGTFDFEVEVLDRLHAVRNVTGDSTSDCNAETRRTTWSSWFRVTVNNTGGNPDTLLINDVTDQTSWSTVGSEDKDDWEVEAYPRADYGDGVDAPAGIEPISDGELELPAGAGSKVQFYLFVRRLHSSSTQCSPVSDPFAEGDGLKVRVQLQSSNQAGLKRSTVVEMRAVAEGEGSVDLLVEQGFQDPGTGRFVEMPDPFPVTPLETRTLTFRVTNRGTFQCVDTDGTGEDARHRNPFSVAFSRPLPPWDVDLDVSGITDGLGAPIGSGGLGDAVVYEEGLVHVDVRVAGHAQAGRIVEGELRISARCEDDPGLDDEEGQGFLSDTVTHPFRLEILPVPGLAARAPQPALEVNAGSTALFSVGVENAGTVAGTYDVRLDADGLPSGWEAETVGLTRLSVPPSRTAYTLVRVTAPEGASPGSTASVEAIVETTVGEGEEAQVLQDSVTLTATVVDAGPLVLDVPVQVKAVDPGGFVDYGFTVRNTGDSEVNVTFGVDGVPSLTPHRVLTPEDEAEVDGPITLEAGGERDLLLRVQEPKGQILREVQIEALSSRDKLHESTPEDPGEDDDGIPDDPVANGDSHTFDVDVPESTSNLTRFEATLEWGMEGVGDQNFDTMSLEVVPPEDATEVDDCPAKVTGNSSDDPGVQAVPGEDKLRIVLVCNVLEQPDNVVVEAGSVTEAREKAKEDHAPAEFAGTGTWTIVVTMEDNGGDNEDLDGSNPYDLWREVVVYEAVDAPAVKDDPFPALNVTTSSTRLLARVVDTDLAASVTVRTHVATTFGVDVSTGRASRAVRGGTPAVYELTVVNEGNGVDTVLLDHETPPQGWSATLTDRELEIGPGRTATVELTVTPPRNAPPGAVAGVRVTATSSTQPDASAFVDTITSVARFDVDLVGDPPTLRVGPGEDALFGLVVRNTGTGTDIVRLAPVNTPEGWQVSFSDDEPEVPAGEDRTVQVHVTPSSTAPPARVVVTVRATSTFDPAKSDTTDLPVRVADYLARDVDGDGVLEAAVDRDGDLANGYEEFLETDRDRGTVSAQVLVVDGDRDDRPDFLLDTRGAGTATAYWSPAGNVFTEAVLADVTGDGLQEGLLDATGDGVTDLVYLPGTGRSNPATSLDIDQDLADEHLVDTTGDGVLDTYYDDGDPRPGRTVRTRTTLMGTDSYAVDSSGDGNHDRVVDTQGRTAEPFGAADAVGMLLTQYWWVLVLLIVVVALFAAVRLLGPRDEHVYRERERER